MRHVIAFMLIVLSAPVAVAEETYARVTVLVPKEGADQQFEEGYKRHLQWHASNGDRWSWYGWTVVSGDRFGTFIDGAFGRTGAELDAPVKPREDAADNNTNVFPHADLETTAFYRTRQSLTSELMAAPFMALLTCRTPAAPANALVLELINGGNRPQFLIFVPAASVSAALKIVGGGECRTELLRYRPDLTYIAP